MNAPIGAAHQGLSASERKPFEKQIDEGIKNLKVGFVSDKNVAMKPADTMQAKALRILQIINHQASSTRAKGDFSAVKPARHSQKAIFCRLGASKGEFSGDSA